MKTCNRCFIEKPIEKFYKDPTSKGGRRNQCTECVRNKQDAYLTPEYRFAAKLKTLYKMTVEQYNEMHESQEGKCFLCGKEWHRRLWVEHNHETGEVRGLACGPCNTALGHLENNPGTLERMRQLLGIS
jgi:thymidylate synthase ThyX